jgi:hypothetical protein
MITCGFWLSFFCWIFKNYLIIDSRQFTLNTKNRWHCVGTRTRASNILKWATLDKLKSYFVMISAINRPWRCETRATLYMSRAWCGLMERIFFWSAIHYNGFICNKYMWRRIQVWTSRKLDLHIKTHFMAFFSAINSCMAFFMNTFRKLPEAHTSGKHKILELYE